MVRTALAVIAGYVASLVVVALGAAVEGAALGPAAAAASTTAYLSIHIAISFGGAILAGYVCARMAPAGRRLLDLALLALVFLAAAVVSARMSGEGSQVLAIHALVTLLGMIGIIAGAMTERAIHGTDAEKHPRST